MSSRAPVSALATAGATARPASNINEMVLILNCPPAGRAYGYRVGRNLGRRPRGRGARRHVLYDRIGFLLTPGLWWRVSIHVMERVMPRTFRPFRRCAVDVVFCRFKNGKTGNCWAGKMWTAPVRFPLV